MRKYIVIVILFAVFCVHPSAAQVTATGADEAKTEVRTLRFVSAFDAPPFAYTEGLKRRGFEVDLGEALGKKMEARVEWEQQIFHIPTLASALQSGRADAVISSISVTEDRKQYFSFTRPYFKTDLAAAILKKYRDFLKNFDKRLEGVTVGVMKGTTGQKWVKKNLSPRTISTYDSPDRLARALRNDDVKVIFLDQAILQYLLARRSYRFEIAKTGLDHEIYAIAVRKGNQKLVEELNAALEKLDEDGEYDRIYNEWFGPPRRLPGE